MKAFYKRHVSSRDDLVLFIGSFALILAAVGVFIHTTVVIVNHTAAPDQPLRYCTAAGLAALGVIFLTCLRIMNSPAYKAATERLKKQSYQDPANWPKGRIDPPDGLSD